MIKIIYLKTLSWLILCFVILNLTAASHSRSEFAVPGSYWDSHNGAPGTRTNGKETSATLKRTRISDQEVLEEKDAREDGSGHHVSPP